MSPYFAIMACIYCDRVFECPALEDEGDDDFVCAGCRDKEETPATRYEDAAFQREVDRSLAWMDHIFGPGWLDDKQEVTRD